MANQYHPSLEEAFDNAPFEPDCSYFEMNPVGTDGLDRIREVITRATVRGLKIELQATGETLRKVGIAGGTEIDGASISIGPADQIGYVRFKVAKPVLPVA